jgi:transposase
MERKHDPDLVTVAVDLNVKNLAVITVRQHGRIIETAFVTDHGLDAHRYRHLGRIAKKQWQSGKPVKGEQSNQQLWRHIDHLNEDAALKVARAKAYGHQIVTVEVNPHGTSQYCSRCGAKGERFSHRNGKRLGEQWGKLFCCPVCHYEANADFNASVNVHHSFYREWHWHPRKAKAPPSPVGEDGRRARSTPSAATGRGGEACGGARSSPHALMDMT